MLVIVSSFYFFGIRPARQNFQEPRLTSRYAETFFGSLAERSTDACTISHTNGHLNHRGKRDRPFKGPGGAFGIWSAGSATRAKNALNTTPYPSSSSSMP